MSQNLVQKLAPRLRQLGKGGYSREYVQRGKIRPSNTHDLLGSLLDGMNLEYRTDVHVPGTDHLRADFFVNGTYLFAGGDLDHGSLKALRESGKKVLVVSREQERSDVQDHGIRVIGLGEDPRRQTIFLDDPSFTFDYAHILPDTQKCSVMHGHTSSVLVEIIGRPLKGMVVDFGAAKEIIREAVRSLDHKLFISEKYVTKSDSKSVSLEFRTVHGEFAIRAPKGTTVLMEGEATVENLSKEILSRIVLKMPENVTAVGVYVYEGMNKGSHLLAEIHANEERKQRKKR